MMKKPDFVHVDTFSWKLEIDWQILGCGHSVLRTLKLAVCQGEMNGINLNLVYWYNFKKAKS